MKPKRPTYNTKFNVTLKNKINSETYVGDVINEESIDGKQFLVVRSNGKVYKFNKDSYTISAR